MISSNSQGHHTSPGAGTSKPLKRGKACLTCRFLKIRCDGARPICGPCQRTPKDDPCEYADGPGRSRTRALEETVSRLEARLREYEHPEETPPVALHDPYEQGLDQESDTTIHIKVSRSTSSYSAHTSPSSPFSVVSPMANIPSPHPGSSGSSERKNSTSPTAEPRIALPATRNLLEWFFTQALSFGFFLNIPRFSNSALLPLNFGHQSRPCPGLLNTVYLWGIHLSPHAQHKDLEHTLLMRALRDTASDLSISNPHPHRLMHTIQAETLLGYFFFRNGNILEAKRHTSSAASLVLGCGLNTLRSSRPQDQDSISASVPAGWITLPPSQDAIEEGERINAFWAVFTLYRNLAVAVDPPRSVCGVFDAPGCQIDTPWPLDMETYKKDILPHRGSSTVYEYLNHIQQKEDEHQLASTTNMITKASLLLHQASFVAGQYHSNMPARDGQALFAAFQSVRHLIDSLHFQMSPLEELDHGSRNISALRDLYLAHSLINGSIIRLNQIFSDTDVNCLQNCIQSAQAMIHGGGLNVAEFGCVNPIMGTLWTLACQTLIQEVLRLRSVRSGQHSHVRSEVEGKGDLQGREDSILVSLQQGLSSLTFFSTNSVLMSKSFSSVPLSKFRYLFRDWVMNFDDVQEDADPNLKEEQMVTCEESIVSLKSWYDSPPAWDLQQPPSLSVWSNPKHITPSAWLGLDRSCLSRSSSSRLYSSPFRRIHTCKS
ncbi:hypothetical protein J3R30DRAFT_3438670 [Lentinula aciculospora]|uniref:Zn(2)-C6 fungal-type domain-containing protein n=1 Tax=Lentinula aciculospora TaxID=153920 RepID=A0A9W9AL17_9AGAR|nr:hypothetical protein J3R30DRAFT_3438670 [Lentinula aciculospora]